MSSINAAVLTSTPTAAMMRAMLQQERGAPTSAPTHKQGPQTSQRIRKGDTDDANILPCTRESRHFSSWDQLHGGRTRQAHVQQDSSPADSNGNEMQQGRVGCDVTCKEFREEGGGQMGDGHGRAGQTKGTHRPTDRWVLPLTEQQLTPV